MTQEELLQYIPDVPNFPKQGITFKDITPLLADPVAFKKLTQLLVQKVPPETTKLLAIESRGFILGAAMAQHLEAGLVLVRKPGKLPRETYSYSYDLEYGSDTLEVHKDQLVAGDKVVIIDDVLATGGTAHAVEQLCANTGADVLKHLFLMELGFLKGGEKLSHPYTSLLNI